MPLAMKSAAEPAGPPVAPESVALLISPGQQAGAKLECAEVILHL